MLRLLLVLPFLLVSCRVSSTQGIVVPVIRSCEDIKGNISNGERIYHLRSGVSYEATKIDKSKGERWFCSESQAVEAGWRKALR